MVTDIAREQLDPSSFASRLELIGEGSEFRHLMGEVRRGSNPTEVDRSFRVQRSQDSLSSLGTQQALNRLGLLRIGRVFLEEVIGTRKPRKRINIRNGIRKIDAVDAARLAGDRADGRGSGTFRVSHDFAKIPAGEKVVAGGALPPRSLDGTKLIRGGGRPGMGFHPLTNQLQKRHRKFNEVTKGGNQKSSIEAAQENGAPKIAPACACPSVAPADEPHTHPHKGSELYG
jgi:hypothetical protein